MTRVGGMRGTTVAKAEWREPSGETGLTLGIVAITALLADLTVLPWLIEKFDRPSKARLKPAISP